MSGLTKGASVAGAMLLAAALAGPAAAQGGGGGGGGPDPDRRIAFCHATGSLENNPYVFIETDVHGAINHFRVHHEGQHPADDIIPRFEWDGVVYGPSGDQSLIENECEVPDEEPTTPPPTEEPTTPPPTDKPEKPEKPTKPAKPDKPAKPAKPAAQPAAPAKPQPAAPVRPQTTTQAPQRAATVQSLPDTGGPAAAIVLGSAGALALGAALRRRFRR